MKIQDIEGMNDLLIPRHNALIKVKNETNENQRACIFNSPDKMGYDFAKAVTSSPYFPDLQWSHLQDRKVHIVYLVTDRKALFANEDSFKTRILRRAKNSLVQPTDTFEWVVSDDQKKDDQERITIYSRVDFEITPEMCVDTVVPPNAHAFFMFYFNP